MQNSILEQAKVAEKGADYMDWAAQVKRQPRKMINFICEKISDRMEPNEPAFIILCQLGRLASPLT